MHVLATAPAKINLTLCVTGKRGDGYHTVHTVMQAIDLRESVEVWNQDEPGITLSVPGTDLPVDSRNTALKAALIFFEKTNLPLQGLGIRVHKHVPMGAGLAGGSADAAAVLAALNTLTGAHLTVDKLCELGSFVGADVPFCVWGGTAVGTGTGADLSPLPPMPPCHIVVAKPPDGISTPEAYRLIDESGISLTHKTDNPMERALQSGDLDAVCQNLTNDFDAVTKLSGVETVKAILRSEGAKGCQMTGSGSAAFGIFTDLDKAEHCIRTLRQHYTDVFLCRPEPDGAKII